MRDIDPAIDRAEATQRGPLAGPNRPGTCNKQAQRGFGAVDQGKQSGETFGPSRRNVSSLPSTLSRARRGLRLAARRRSGFAAALMLGVWRAASPSAADSPSARMLAASCAGDAFLDDWRGPPISLLFLKYQMRSGATMARVTVEIASTRSRTGSIGADRGPARGQVSGGADLTIERDRDKNPGVVALREIARKRSSPRNFRKRSSRICKRCRSTRKTRPRSWPHSATPRKRFA